MTLSNLFSNKLNNLVNSFEEENIISCHPGKNATSPQLLATKRNRVTSNSELDEGMEGSNKDTLDVSFFY